MNKKVWHSRRGRPPARATVLLLLRAHQLRVNRRHHLLELADRRVPPADAHAGEELSIGQLPILILVVECEVLLAARDLVVVDDVEAEVADEREGLHRRAGLSCRPPRRPRRAGGGRGPNFSDPAGQSKSRES